MPVGVECCTIGLCWTSVTFLFCFVFWLGGDKIGRSSMMQDTCVIGDIFFIIDHKLCFVAHRTVTVRLLLWLTLSSKGDQNFIRISFSFNGQIYSFNIYFFCRSMHLSVFFSCFSQGWEVWWLSPAVTGWNTILSNLCRFKTFCWIRQPLPIKSLHWPWAYVSFYMRFSTFLNSFRVK